MTNPNLDNVKRRDWTILLWSEKTWSERVQTVVCWIIAVIVTGAIALVGLYVLGSSLEGVGQYNDQHDRCLQHATNGYEIKQCR